MVNPNQVMAAGLAATAASLVTSRFGVAGTLLGAALTAMIITGGSAILKSYMETVSGRVRGMPTKIRSRRVQQRAGDFGGTMPGRPELRDNFVGRMRAALDWFSHLPALSRRSILIKGFLAAAVAFVICMGVVWGPRRSSETASLAAFGRSVLTVQFQASTQQDTAAPVRDLLSRAVA
jgi:hypothetical protein